MPVSIPQALNPQALLPRAKAPRRRKTTTREADLADDIPVAEIKKLDDVTDCFLQAAAWIAWEANRLQLLAVCGDGAAERRLPVGEEGIRRMAGECGEA